MILQQIQEKLKAPKNAFNNHGKYKYRKAEDILTALKPLLAEHKASVLISDDISLVGDRYYIKATVTLHDETNAVLATTTAFARETLDRKGMDQSQITGTASSYARKYALNGMFLIDDTEDSDSMDNSHSEKDVNNSQPAKVNASQVKLIQTRLSKLQDRDTAESMLKSHYNIESWNDLDASAMTGLIDWFNKQPQQGE